MSQFGNSKRNGSRGGNEINGKSYAGKENQALT